MMFKALSNNLILFIVNSFVLLSQKPESGSGFIKDLAPDPKKNSQI
jgi:hypothetical protein